MNKISVSVDDFRSLQTFKSHFKKILRTVYFSDQLTNLLIFNLNNIIDILREKHPTYRHDFFYHKKSNFKENKYFSVQLTRKRTELDNGVKGYKFMVIK